jgi:hypothetical protein
VTSRRISLRKPSPEPEPPPVTPEPEQSSGPVSLGKGRPTPKRSDAQKRRGGPVPPPPATRREAAKRLRAQQAAERGSRSGRGGGGGQAARMLPRDAGPVRALVRDIVDGRRNVGVIMLPIALTFVIAQLVGNLAVLEVASRAFTLSLLLVIADLVVTASLIRRILRARFPEEKKLRGHIGYGLVRTTVLRRLRMPPTRVRPGPLFRR